MARSPQAHIEQAERYADAVIAGLATAREGEAIDDQTIQLAEMMLHAAEVEVMLAQVGVWAT